MAVSDIGNRFIGTVSAVGDGSFELDMVGDGCLWVDGEALFWVGRAGATLICESSRVWLYTA